MKVNNKFIFVFILLLGVGALIYLGNKGSFSVLTSAEADKNINTYVYSQPWTEKYGQARVDVSIRLTEQYDVDGNIYSPYNQVVKQKVECSGTALYFYSGRFTKAQIDNPDLMESYCSKSGCKNSDATFGGGTQIYTVKDGNGTVPNMMYVCWGSNAASNGDSVWAFTSYGFYDSGKVVDRQSQEYADLQAQLKAKLDQINNLNTDIATKAALIDSLQLDANRKAQVISNLNLTIQQNAQLISKLQITAQEQANVIAQLQATAAQRAQIIITLQSNLADQANTIASMRLSVEEQAKLISAFNYTIQQNTVTINALKLTVDQQAALINSLTSNLAEKAYYVSQLQAENENQARLIQEMKLSFSNQVSIIDHLNLTIQGDADLIKRFNYTLDQQAVLINTLTKSIDEKVQLIEKLQTNLQQQQELYSKIAKDNEELKLLLDKANETIQSDQSTITALLNAEKDRQFRFKLLVGIATFFGLTLCYVIYRWRNK